MKGSSAVGQPVSWAPPKAATRPCRVCSMADSRDSMLPEPGAAQAGPPKAPGSNGPPSTNLFSKISLPSLISLSLP